MKNKEILERIMTQHWDMHACECWVCTEARVNGLRPKECYLPGHQAPEDRRPAVRVAWEGED